MSSKQYSLVVFDIETTGLDQALDEIIQIGAVVVNLPDGKEIDYFNKLIRPSPMGIVRLEKLKKEAPDVYRYSQEKWEDVGVSAEIGLREFSAFVKRFAWVNRVSLRGKPYSVALLGGHNTSTFDLPFLLSWMKRYNIFFPANLITLDLLTIALAAQLIKAPQMVGSSLKLGDLCKMFNIELTEAHDALADVRATAQLLVKILWPKKVEKEEN